MSKYEKLQELLQRTRAPDTSLEKKYHQNLEQQIKQYEQFITIAKPHTRDKIPIQDEIAGIFETNKKIPFNVERGDTIGVSLANDYADTQISESESYIRLLKTKSQELSTQIETKQEISNKLDVFIQDLERRVNDGDEETHQDDVTKLEKQIRDGKKRYKQLRTELQKLSQEYD